MSLYGALFAGVSGLTAQSNTLSVISNNIANVNTVGFKGATGGFESLVTSSAGSAFSPGGVIGTTTQEIGLQGQLQTTSSPTDIGILGNGFFVVNSSTDGTGQVLYTRAGDFTQDKTGNFENSAGFYLQAWPLDRNGLLPGAPGNSTDTTSSANLSSLETVNVNNLTGSASATTTISIGANLDASATASIGAGVVASLDASDNANFGATGLTSTGLIVPSSQDSLSIGDSFKVTTAGGVNATYNYGGLTSGTTITSGHASTSSTLGSLPLTLDSVSGSTTTFTVAMTGASSVLAAGDTVTLSGNTQNIDGITADTFNGSFIVSNVQANSYQITVNSAAASRAVTFATDGSTNQVTVTDPNIGDLQNGDSVTFANLVDSGGTIGGIPFASLTSSSFVVSNVNTLTGTYTITSPVASTSADTVGTGTALTSNAGTTGMTANTRLFTGGVLNANQPTDTFLGTLSTNEFTSAGLTFSITNGTGTATFSYVAGTPNASQGQFNTLDNLASAISGSSTGLTARVVGGQLWVGSVNADDAVTFNNGSSAGISGPPVQSGIDWTGELGLTNIAAGANRFSSLQGLSDVINATQGLTATVNNATGAASLSINADSPLDQITFTDTPVGTVTGSHTQTGSVLAALGVSGDGVTIPTLGGLAPTSGTANTTGALGPAYSATDSTKSMASGSTTPQFSHPVQVYDSQGTAHNLNVGFIKTGTNTWAVEIYAVPASDVTATDGQVAYGTVVFNGDGTLNNISGTISGAIPVSWADGSNSSTINISWGTEGAIGVGKTDGLSQFDSPYIVNFANQNGVPVGQLSSVAIDKNGFITASYSNGQTQKLYQIPLAQFTNPNELTPLSNNVYVQSEASGVVNLSQAGSGGAGTISSSSLEASNVELANELTTMIIAQRSYEANTKVISTADTLLQDLNQIIQ